MRGPSAAEVSGLDPLVLGEPSRAVGENDASQLEHVRPAGDAERHERVLLDEQNRRPRLVDAGQGREDLTYQVRLSLMQSAAPRQRSPCAGNVMIKICPKRTSG